MTDSRKVVVTAGLSVAAMAALFGALAFWIMASIARDPQAGGSVTLLTAAALLCALLGVGLFALAVRRVRARFRLADRDE